MGYDLGHETRKVILEAYRLFIGEFEFVWRRRCRRCRLTIFTKIHIHR